MAKIYIGKCDKIAIVNEYCCTHNIKNIYIIGDDMAADFHIQCEFIKFREAQCYKWFYKLLQQINGDTLIILNECLKKRNRYDLIYNCIRRYVLQTPHRLIFNYFPIIKEQEDFMILYDMVQNNPFLKEPYKYITKFENIEIGEVEFHLSKTDITIDDEIVKQYEQEKEKIIMQVNQDPDIIPRRLLKFSEKNKPKGYDKLDKIKPIMNVAVSQLKVDLYYYNELLKFEKELKNVLQRIHK